MSIGRGYKGSGQCQWGSRALIMRPTEEGKKILLCREVLILIDRSVPPEGSEADRLRPGLEGVGRNLTCTLQGPGGSQVAANHLSQPTE